jgi:hypothetical protein
VRISTAVRITGLSRSRIYELIQAGDLETVRSGAPRSCNMEASSAHRRPPNCARLIRAKERSPRRDVSLRDPCGGTRLSV